MGALAEAVSSTPAPATDAFEIDMDEGDDGEDDLHFHNACLDEIDRYRRIDEWIPSYHNILSTTALDCKQKLIAAGAMPFRPVEFIQYTHAGTSDILRLTAFRNLMDLGLVKNDAVFRWFLSALGMDPSPYVRDRMLRLLNRALGAISIGENSDPATLAAAQQDSLIIEQESSTDARRDDLARKQTVEGALKAFKAEMGKNEVLKKGLWDIVTSPISTLREIGDMLQICELLYEPESSMIVVLKYPRYWQLSKVGKVCSSNWAPLQSRGHERTGASSLNLGTVMCSFSNRQLSASLRLVASDPPVKCRFLSVIPSHRSHRRFLRSDFSSNPQSLERIAVVALSRRRLAPTPTCQHSQSRVGSSNLQNGHQSRVGLELAFLMALATG